MRLTLLLVATSLIAALGLWPPLVVQAELPTSGVYTRQGNAPSVTSFDTEVRVDLPATEPTKVLNKVSYQLGAQPDGVKVSICRMDTTPTCHEVTGSTSGDLSDWKGKTTRATYSVKLLAPGGGGASLPTDVFPVTLKLFYN